MVPPFVFLLGRLGCGKSTVHRLLEQRLRKEGLASEVMRIGGFPMPQRSLDEDVNFKRHHRKRGGFVVTDFTVVDDVLRCVNDRLKELERLGRVIFANFARNRCTRALENFDQELLKRSLIRYVHCPFDVCVERNVRGFREVGERTPDGHIARLTWSAITTRGSCLAGRMNYNHARPRALGGA